MFDIWIDGVNIAPIIWILILIVILPIQLVLCFRVKSKILRMLPVIIFSALTAVFGIAAAVGIGWDVLFYLICTVYFAIMLFVCGVGWGVWAIAGKVKK